MKSILKIIFKIQRLIISYQSLLITLSNKIKLALEFTKPYVGFPSTIKKEKRRKREGTRKKEELSEMIKQETSLRKIIL